MLKPRLINVAFIVVASLLTACFLLVPPPRSYVVSLDDVDGDGDLDAVVGNGPGNTDYSGEPNAIWLNDGAGHFTDTGQRLIGSHGTKWDVTYAVALGDLDSDGDIDAVFGNAIPSPNTVWLNDGAGQYKLHGEVHMKPHNQFDYSIWGSDYAVNLADVDGDGDEDVFAIRFTGDCLVWRNDGTGRFGPEGDRAITPIYLAVGGVIVLGLGLFGWQAIRRKGRSFGFNSKLPCAPLSFTDTVQVAQPA
jgi:hypothetical protein